MTDEQLVADFLTHRDGSAFEAIVRRYGPMVLRVCRDVLGTPADAEDAFQATFLVLVRQGGAIRDHSAVGRWLCEVAWRISRRERRRLARLRSHERQAPAMDPPARPDRDPADRELKPILHDEIRRLPPSLRDPILLCYFEGLTVEEAARRLAVPLGTLKSRLARGRDRLRDRLTRRGLAASALLLLMFSLTEEVSAGVPGPLLDSTVRAGLHGGGIPRRVAAMVVEDGARDGWSRSLAPWALLAALLLGLGAVRMVPTSSAQAAGGPSAAAPAPALDARGDCGSRVEP